MCKLFVLTPSRFLHFRKYYWHRDLMGNFFNNGPIILKLIVRVRIYHILIKIVDLQTEFLRIFFCRFIEVTRMMRSINESEVWVEYNNIYISKFSFFAVNVWWLDYNYLCNQCLSPLMLWVRTPFIARCTRYNIMW